MKRYQQESSPLLTSSGFKSHEATHGSRNTKTTGQVAARRKRCPSRCQETSLASWRSTRGPKMEKITTHFTIKANTNTTQPLWIMRVESMAINGISADKADQCLRNVRADEGNRAEISQMRHKRAFILHRLLQTFRQASCAITARNLKEMAKVSGYSNTVQLSIVITGFIGWFGWKG